MNITTERCMCGHTRHSHVSWGGACDRRNACGCMKFRHVTHTLGTKIFLLGSPGAGKSTIVKALAKELDQEIISGGDIARNLAETNPEVRLALDRGDMAPESLMNSTMIKILLNKGPDPLIVDGYPRYWEQMADVMRFITHPHYFVCISAPFDTILKRMAKRNRDTEVADLSRINIYHRRTAPVITWLLDRHTCLDINNEDTNSIDDHVKSIINYVESGEI